MKVLLAQADGDEAVTADIADRLGAAGYEVCSQATVLVGESVVEETSKALTAGAPVVLCATVRAIGTGWAHRLVNAARKVPGTRVYVLQMDRDAYVEQLAFDGKPAEYWRDPAGAIDDLFAALAQHFPSLTSGEPSVADIESRYRALALEVCDIIDLANLPETDRHIATRQLELRRLYVALRVRQAADGDDGSTAKESKGAEDEEGKEVPGEDVDGEPTALSPLGSRLSTARRLVVLGGPGAGKSTLVRWLATAYLLRLKEDPAWAELPDVQTLPDEDWLPVIVRCRDLTADSLGGSLDDILLNSLRKSEFSAAEASTMRDVLRRRLVEGSALLLIDGLDEIADPAVRARFCRQLHTVGTAYPKAAVVATSRLVGYREMGYRLGPGFEHVVVADFSPADKDDFAHRWCALTEPRDRVRRAAEDLIADIHSTDRIEHLTGNPMLLTTMALVKRKVGKLPNRRADLYWDAVEVLLNWRPEIDEPLDHHEAVPQLEYLAYTMCRRGVQRLREDEVLGLLSQMREEYPQVHAIHKHSVQDFCRLLERRTGILVETGHVRHRGRPTPVFEFRHLTFQEYLAGLALVDGRYPDRDRSLSLAEAVGPLAGLISRVPDPGLPGVAPDRGGTPVRASSSEFTVVESWSEALRLCVASCNDDDVDSALLAIARPRPGEATRRVSKPRAVLAALCVADEPNCSRDVALEIMGRLIDVVTDADGKGTVRTTIDSATVGLGVSRWEPDFSRLLAARFIINDDPYPCGGLCGMSTYMRYTPTGVESDRWFEARLAQLGSDDETEVVESCLALMNLGFRVRPNRPDAHGVAARVRREILLRLVGLLDADMAVARAAAWALFWLGGRSKGAPRARRRGLWPTPTAAVPRVVAAIARDPGEPFGRFLAAAAGTAGARQAVAPLIALAAVEQAPELRERAVEALGYMADPDAAEALLKIASGGDRTAVRAANTLLSNELAKPSQFEPLLDAPDPAVRRIALQGMASKLPRSERRLLSEDLDAFPPYLDPRATVRVVRVRKVARALGQTEGEVKATYEQMQERYGLKLSWRRSG